MGKKVTNNKYFIPFVFGRDLVFSSTSERTFLRCSPKCERWDGLVPAQLKPVPPCGRATPLAGFSPFFQVPKVLHTSAENMLKYPSQY